MRPEFGESGGVLGFLASRNEIGELSPQGWTVQGGLISSTDTVVQTFEHWGVQHGDLAQHLSGWAGALEELGNGPCQLRFGISDGNAYLLAANRMRAPGETNARVLVDLVGRRVLSKRNAVLLSEPEEMRPTAENLLNSSGLELLGVGAAFDPIAATGIATLGPVTSGEMGKLPRILLRESLGPSDAHDIPHCVGVVVGHAGPSSHLVVMARGMGKAVISCGDGLSVSPAEGLARLGGHDVREGEWLTIDGAVGALRRGMGEMVPALEDSGAQIARWARAGSIPLLASVDSADDLAHVDPAMSDGIGLCRSERHLTTAREVAALNALVARRLDNVADLAGAQDLLDTLAQKLFNLLKALGGRPLHYRLLEVGDVEASGHVGAEMRGARWGIFSGFYAHQIQMASQVVSRLATDGVPVDIVIVAPFVSLAAEAAWLRAEVARVFSAIGNGHIRVRIGCMLESPLGVMSAQEISESCDVLCIGTNDLTECVWATTRADRSGLLARWASSGFIAGNPFQHLSMQDVGGLVCDVVRAARASSPERPVVVCGEQASSVETARIWKLLGRPAFSCRPNALAAVSVALYQTDAQGGESMPPSRWPERTADLLGRNALRSAQREILNGRPAEALGHAWTWAAETARVLGLPEPTNWKFFKRDVVALWFGANPGRRFPPGWQGDEVLAYVKWLRNQDIREEIRYSVFPASIASHATSGVLERIASPESWREQIDRLDRGCALEVFPQQGTDRLCFRANYQAGHVHVEAGRGQAMFVFEVERGSHAIVTANLWPTVSLGDVGGADESLREEFRQFLDQAGEAVALRLLSMQESLGLEWVGVEGYYETGMPLVVCDIDLPFDFVISAGGRSATPQPASAN